MENLILLPFLAASALMSSMAILNAELWKKTKTQVEFVSHEDSIEYCNEL